MPRGLNSDHACFVLEAVHPLYARQGQLWPQAAHKQNRPGEEGGILSFADGELGRVHDMPEVTQGACDRAREGNQLS